MSWPKTQDGVPRTSVTGVVALDMLIRDGLVEADGPLSIRVNAFRYDVATIMGLFAGVVAQAVTDNAVSYVYLDADEVLQITTAGWPLSGPHVHLARVTAAGGTIVAISDERVFLTAAGGVEGQGEDNTASNLGSGAGVFAQKVGVDLQFKSVVAGARMTLTPSASEITVATTAANVGAATPESVTAAAGSAGASADASRADHRHQVSVAAPVSVGSANSAGTADTLSRSDHVHAHGNQAGGSTHSVATGSVDGFESAADKTKLDAFSSATEYTRRDGTVAFTGSQSMGNQALTAIKTASFQAELDNGNSGAAKTITWASAQRQKLTLTANCTLTFSAPPGVGNLQLKVLQDANGGWNVTWPASVYWSKGLAPQLTVLGNARDLVTFYYDGTNYFGAFLEDFK